jgi:hypothetical protein
MKRSLSFLYFALFSALAYSQGILKTMLRLPDTGQTISYTNTFGEDADFYICTPFIRNNWNGTLTDTITSLMWQQADGGEMTIENAAIYCDTLTLAGYTDWRLPNAHESFSILNHQHSNPALDLAVFSTTVAEYWWTSDRQANDSNKVWVTNAGGGIGNHPKSETISAGGTKRFHVRAVRDVNTPAALLNHFTDNGNGTITDNLTELIWQQTPFQDTLTWEEALSYADTLSLVSIANWRLPNIKELQSINDEVIINPSLNTNYFNVPGDQKYWSSTTLPNQVTKAWYLDTQFGLTTYDFKTLKHYVICVVGSQGNSNSISEMIDDKIYQFAWPNPFTSKIYLTRKGKQNKVELLDSFGRIVYSGCHIESKDFSFLAKGIYFLRFTEDKLQTVKIIKD